MNQQNVFPTIGLKLAGTVSTVEEMQRIRTGLNRAEVRFVMTGEPPKCRFWVQPGDWCYSKSLIDAVQATQL